MKQRIDLAVEPREIGKANNRALRVSRRVPAIVYGSAIENTPLFLEVNDVVKYNTRAYENTLFNLKSSNKAASGKVVLIKEVIVHPVTRVPEHVDLFAIDLKKAVRIDVELSFTGKPIGLAEGGLLNIVNRTISIECLPTEIPENIVVDISNLGLGDSIHVSDLQIPTGLKVISSLELTLCVVNLIEEEAAAPVAAAAATPAAATAAAPGKDAKAPAAGKDAPKAPAKK